MVQLNNILYKFDNYCRNCFPIYIKFGNLLREWWKARHVYKFPRIVFTKGIYSQFRCYNGDNYNPMSLIFIEFIPLAWKHKWDYICYEERPEICISILRKYFLNISLAAPCNGIDSEYPADTEYWESMLNYLYKYNKDLQKTYNKWGWVKPYYEDYIDENGTRNIRQIKEENTWRWEYIKNPEKYVH